MKLKEEISKSETNIVSHRENLQSLSRNFDDEQKLSHHALADMQEASNDMEQHTLERINGTELQVETMRCAIDAKKLEIARTRDLKDREIESNDREILDLQSRLDAMALEFSNMIRDVTERIRMRVDLTHAGWGSDFKSSTDGKGSMLSRLTHFSQKALSDPARALDELELETAQKRKLAGQLALGGTITSTLKNATMSTAAPATLSTMPQTLQ